MTFVSLLTLPCIIVKVQKCLFKTMHLKKIRIIIILVIIIIIHNFQVLGFEGYAVKKIQADFRQRYRCTVHNSHKRGNNQLADSNSVEQTWKQFRGFLGSWVNYPKVSANKCDSQHFSISNKWPDLLNVRFYCIKVMLFQGYNSLNIGVIWCQVKRPKDKRPTRL